MLRSSVFLSLIASAVICNGCKTASNTNSNQRSQITAAPGPILASLIPMDVPRADLSPGVQQVKATQTGLAVFLGEEFQGKRTTSGEAFDKNEMVAAHPTYPMGTVVRVINLKNDRMVAVRVVDRGPIAKVQKQGVIIDLSRSAAEQLDFIKQGRASVRVEVLDWGGQLKR